MIFADIGTNGFRKRTFPKSAPRVIPRPEPWELCVHARRTRHHGHTHHLFRPLREKPVLTDEDIKARFAFANKYKGKSASCWLKEVHMFADNKTFPVYHHPLPRPHVGLTRALEGKQWCVVWCWLLCGRYINHAGRVHAARRRVRGQFRKPSDGLKAGHVRAGRSLKFNPGAKAQMVAAGIGKGKVLAWHEVPRLARSSLPSWPCVLWMSCGVGAPLRMKGASCREMNNFEHPAVRFPL